MKQKPYRTDADYIVAHLVSGARGYILGVSKVTIDGKPISQRTLARVNAIIRKKNREEGRG